MILVETRPQRMRAIQWHQEGDALEAGVQSYFIAKEKRWGVPTMAGMQRVRPGDWIVIGDTAGAARVYDQNEFHLLFKIVEEGQSS